MLKCCDALDGLKSLESDSIDLVVTSPPYLEVRKSYQSYSEEEYLKWFLPISQEIYRVLKENGSFILNINDAVVGSVRSIYIYELVTKLVREQGYYLFDTLIWTKKNGARNAGKYRRSDYFEFIFHFSKSKKVKFYPDDIRTPYAKSTLARAKYAIKEDLSNREKRQEDNVTGKKTWTLHPLGAWPNNLLDFKKDPGKTHVASFHIDLPTHFIKAHSDEGDLILDPFAGKGTTLAAARNLKRKYLGFELKKEHVLMAQKEYGLEIS